MNNNLTMYRIKHSPSGLYYKPGDSNLSVKGKVYTSGNSILSLYADSSSICISIKKSSKVYDKLKDMLKFAPASKSSAFVIAYIPKSDFEKEIIQLS